MHWLLCHVFNRHAPSNESALICHYCHQDISTAKSIFSRA